MRKIKKRRNFERKTMKKIFSFVLLLLFLFSNAVFARENPVISGNLRKKALQEKTMAKTSAPGTIGVIFFPENDDAARIDTSFFRSKGIEYIKSENFLSAEIPAEAVDELINIKGVENIDLNIKAKALGKITEGRDAVNASMYAYNNVNGEGVKIAVIDVGFYGYENLQASGELPADLVTKDFTKFGNPGINSSYETELHGSGCAEVIYDFVPKAKMYLLKISDAPSLQNAFAYCKVQNISIASCSIGFSVGFWCDGSGDFARMATSAYNKGILPVFAAGNEAENSWFGIFNGGNGGWMIFPDGKDYLKLYVPAHGEVWMMWDDFAARDKEYILYMYDGSGTALLDSSSWSAGSKPSVYVSNNSAFGRYVRIKIKKNNLSENVNIRLYFDGFYADSSDKKSESSLSSPADSREAVSVGAVNVFKWVNGPIDGYSSWGPTRATPILPQAQKPDIVAPSYVTTFSYGNRAFLGTSAATPHVAASAALLLSLDRTMSVDRLKEKLFSYYKPIASSPDNIYGRGKLVLGDSGFPGESDVGNIICYPNPASISRHGRINITNFPYAGEIEVYAYTVTGEFVKGFDASDLKLKNGKMTIEWDLKNGKGLQIAPGVYFITVKTPLGGQKVKKIAVKK